MRHFKTVLLSIVLVLSIVGLELQAATPPQTQAGFITFQNTTNSGTKMSWVNGSGAGRIVVVSTTNNFATYPPINNITYNVVEEGNYSNALNPTLGTGKVIYNGTGSKNSVDVTGLAACTTYWFRVYDYNQGGSPSPAYNTNTRTLNPRQLKTAPAAPINLAANDTSSYSATLSWDPSGCATSYHLDLSLGNGGAFDANIVEPYNDLDIGDITEFELSDLIQNTNYWFRVRAVANGLSSENSGEFPFTTIASTPPTFTMQYYADASLTQSLGDNPRLGVGTYYLALTADQPMQYAPAIRIDANGNGTWENPPDIFPEVVLTSYGDNVYVYTRTVVADPSFDGTSPENYIVHGVGLSGLLTNTGFNAAITNWGTKAAYIDTDAPAATNVSCTVPGDGTYGIGENITILVDFDDNVIVTGAPRLRLNVGPGIVRYATFNNVGSGTGTLEFLYTVQANDYTLDLDYLNASALTLNGGTIKDNAGNPAALVLPAPGDPGSLGDNNDIIIDGIAPVITDVTSNLADGTYGEGQVVDILVTFSENVNILGGLPELVLNTTPAQNAVYDSYDVLTFTATFLYTVQPGDYSADLDYATFDALILGSATIKDIAGNDANTELFTPGEEGSLGSNKNIVIDAVAPEVVNVTSQNFNQTYGTGKQIIIDVEFNKPVFVTGGNPILNLNSTGSGTNAFATWNGFGSGTNTLHFIYVVLEGHQSADLNYSATNSLEFNGSEIRDGSNTLADLTLPAPAGPNSLGSNKDIVIDGTIKTITDVYADLPDGSYGANEACLIFVEFETEVFVLGGTPQLTLNTVPQSTCSYIAGSETNTLWFLYIVPNGVYSADLDYTGINALDLNGATIRDAFDNDVNLTLPVPGAEHSLGFNNNIIIDAIAPVVESVTSPTATYSVVGDLIDISVNFSEVVNVDTEWGTPTLALNIGGVTKYAPYASGTGTATLIFQYTVDDGDVQAPLDYSNTNALELNGSVIYDDVDSSQNLAVLTLPAVGSGNNLAPWNVVINTNVPFITNVTAVPPTGIYNAGAVVNILVQFSEAVFVDNTLGDPKILLNIVDENGLSIPRYAVYNDVVGDGTNTLQFDYEVQMGDNSDALEYWHPTDPVNLAFDLNQSIITNALSLNASTVLPTPGDPFSLGFNTDIIIDTRAPIVTNVTSTPANGMYETGDIITFEVTFDEVVFIVDNARLLLETGPVDHFAYYNGIGNGTNTLQFEYTVQADDYTEHLDYFDQYSLETVFGSTIRDEAGNDAFLLLPEPGTPGSLGANTNILIIGDTPYVLNVTATNADGGYTIDDIIYVTVEFNNPVDVPGIPQLQLETNNGVRFANYTGMTGNILTFEYTIVAGDFTTDLDYTATNALTGVIYATGTTDNAILTLPAPGAEFSLGFNKAIEISTVAPEVTVTFNNYALGVATFDVVFEQNVFNFVALNVDGGAFSGAPIVTIIPIDGANYTVQVEGMDQNGTVEVQVPAGAAQNGVGLDNLESNLVIWDYDLTAPTVVITDDYDPTDLTDQLPIRFTVTFDMPVYGFGAEVADVVTLGTANVTNVLVTPANIGMTEFFVDITVSSNGTVQIEIPFDAAKSVAGDISNEPSLPSHEITFTAPAPTLIITRAAGQSESTITLPINFTVTFSEDVTGFDASGITIGGTAAGTATATVTGAGTTYNVAIAGVTANGTINITVKGNAAENSFGTFNALTGPGPNVTYWGIAPIPTITYVGADPTSASPINFTVTFDQNVQGFEDGDINLDGTANPTTAVVTGGPAIYNVAVSGMTSAGTVSINFAAGAAENGGGMESTAPVPDPVPSVTFEVAAPNVTINQAFGQADPTGDQPIWFDVVFDQDVTGFDAATDVTVQHSNPEQGAMTVTIIPVDAQNYQVSVTGITKNGTITATIPAGVAVNGFGVPNNASTSTDNTVEFMFDAPVLTLEIADGQPLNAAALPIMFTATFDQLVNDFDNTDINVGGTAAGVALITVQQDALNPMVYHIAISNITQNGTINVSVDADKAFNSYGTGNLAAGPTYDVTYWGIAPTATIERVTATPTQTLPIEFTVTFSQPVTGFDDSDINFGTSTANPSNVTVTPAGPAEVYNVTIGNVANNGTVIIGFIAGAAQNAGGVGNLAPVYQPDEAGVVVEFTTPAPNCVLALAGGQVSPTNQSPILFTATFSQPVWGLTAEEISVSLAGNPYNDVTITAGVDGDAVYTISVNNLPSSGEVIVTVPAGAAQNLYAEDNTASNPQNCVYDIDRPVPTIDLVSDDPTNITPVVYTVTFDKPVFGFDENALTVTGPFAGAATIDIIPVGLGQTEWTIEISGMNADGLISLSVIEDAATDLVGNGNIAAGPVTCQYNLPPLPPPGPSVNALSVRYFTRTTVALNITQPALPTILIGKQIDAGPLAPELSGPISNYAAVASLTFNPTGTLADGSCVLYVGSSSQVTVTGLLRNTTYTFALYTYDALTGMYCLDADAAMLSQLTQNRESLLEQDPIGAIAGTNIVLSTITPNPVVNNVNLTMDLFTDANITVQVIDGNGQVISVPVNGNFYAEGTHTLSFPLQNVASGSYFLRVLTDNEAVIQRFIYMP